MPGHPEDGGLTTDERQELAQLRRENRRLRGLEQPRVLLNLPPGWSSRSGERERGKLARHQPAGSARAA
jgi:hypothetical protein